MCLSKLYCTERPDPIRFHRKFGTLPAKNSKKRKGGFLRVGSAGRLRHFLSRRFEERVAAPSGAPARRSEPRPLNDPSIRSGTSAGSARTKNRVSQSAYRQKTPVGTTGRRPASGGVPTAARCWHFAPWPRFRGAFFLDASLDAFFFDDTAALSPSVQLR